MPSINIIDANLTFGSLSRRASTNRIILHHAEASVASPEDIQRWHVEGNGWAGAGYHFLVRKDGTVYSMRPEWAVGSHAKGSNSDSIGVCFEGDYMFETMPQAQLDAGRELVAYLKAKYGIEAVLRHRDVYDTNCPGDRFPFDQIAGAKPTTKEDELIRIDIPSGTYPVYRAYRGDVDDHFFTASKSEYDSLPARYVREGVAFNGADTGEVIYRLFNPNAKQHMYTTDFKEASGLVKAGWRPETVTFAAARSGREVYRLYNPNTGSHHFTTEAKERGDLERAGWKYEGVAFRAVG